MAIIIVFINFIDLNRVCKQPSDDCAPLLAVLGPYKTSQCNHNLYYHHLYMVFHILPLACYHLQVHCYLMMRKRKHDHQYHLLL